MLKPTRWLMLLLVSISLFGVACAGPEPEVEETEPLEEVSPEEMEEEEMEEMEEEIEEPEGE
jgi:hypothetical protein